MVFGPNMQNFEAISKSLTDKQGAIQVRSAKELEDALTELIGPNMRGDRGPVRIGSVKSMIGHLKSAAGAASRLRGLFSAGCRAGPRRGLAYPSTRSVIRHRARIS